MRVVGCEHQIREPSGGPTWEAMGASWAPPAYIIYETITKKQVSISIHNNNNNRFTALSISIRTVK